jgi:hypothetical protein
MGLFNFFTYSQAIIKRLVLGCIFYLINNCQWPSGRIAIINVFDQLVGVRIPLTVLR